MKILQNILCWAGIVFWIAVGANWLYHAWPHYRTVKSMEICDAGGMPYTYRSVEEDRTGTWVIKSVTKLIPCAEAQLYGFFQGDYCQSTSSGTVACYSEKIETYHL